MTTSPSSRPADQTVMMIGACLLFLGGLMIGFPVDSPGAPVIGLAHTLGPLEAVFMFAFVALRPYLRFSAFNAWLFCAATIVAFCANFAGVSITVLTGAGAGMYLPPWDAYLDNAPSLTNFWVYVLLDTSPLALILPFMMVVGWMDSVWQSNRLQTVTAIVSVPVTIALLVLSFAMS